MTYELAREWVHRGHQVTVFTSDQEDGTHRFQKLVDDVDGIRVHRFRNPSHTLATRYPYLFFRPSGLAAALRQLKGAHDVVHVAESRGPHNRWVARGIHRDIPVVFSAYGGLADGAGIRRVYRHLHDRLYGTAAIVQACSGLIAQTSHEERTYRRFGAEPGRIHLIPLAVNWHDFTALPGRGAFRQRLGLTREHRVVLFVGRIHWTKGLQLLIPAFAKLTSQVPLARLVIVGWDHGYMSAARGLVSQFGIEDRVLFPGPLYDRDRFSAYVDADLFALTPVVYEETSLAALEACASGTGCIITQQCEIPGLEAANAGRLVDARETAVTDALAAALVQGHSVEWGANARRMVQANFTVEVVARLHEQLFERVIASAAGRSQ